MPCFRFSLRTFLLLLALLAIPLGWIAKERRQSAREQALAIELQKQGWEVELGGAFFSTSLPINDQGWWRPFAGKVSGDRILRLSPGNLELSNVGFLSELSCLYLLVIYEKHISCIPAIESLNNLQELCICGSKTVKGSAYWKIRNFDWRDGLDGLADVAPLSKLHQLKRLSFSNLDISDRQLDELKAALPNCKVGVGFVVVE